MRLSRQVERHEASPSNVGRLGIPDAQSCTGPGGAPSDCSSCDDAAVSPARAWSVASLKPRPTS